MLTLLFVILLVLGIIFIIKGSKLTKKSKEDKGGHYYSFEFTQLNGSGIFISGIILVVVVSLIFLIMAVMTNKVVQGRVINQKIEMYQEENKNIEDKMDVLVKQYMTYEQTTLSEFKSDSSITLVSLYPELKSDKLVQQQLDTCVDNNNKIKDLKSSLLDVSTSRWWLYFGK